MAAASLPVLSAPPAAQHPLRERNFRMLWAGSGVSAVGDQFYLVALPWVVLQLTGSAVAVGTILMAVAIPRAMRMHPPRRRKIQEHKVPKCAASATTEDIR
jgi:hypothetical protein